MDLGLHGLGQFAEITIYGNGGNDVVRAGNNVLAEMVIYGGLRNDWLDGGDGDDVINGFDGDDDIDAAAAQREQGEMPMITLWGRANSVNVMKVLWLLDELALPFHRIDAGGAFGRTTDPDYLAMNPNATVPTLVMPNGWSLWESNAILRYLCRTQPGGNAFYPEAPEARADVERWMDWQLASLGEPMRVLFWTFVRTPEAERDMAAVAKALSQANRLWGMLEAQLATRDYPAGPFSIADMALGGFLHRWFSLPIERAEMPRLRAWYERLLERPAYRKHVAVPMS